MADKFCLVGDLHGRIDLLEYILSKSKGYRMVFLGDTIHHKQFFKRTKRTSPIRMLQKLMSLCANDGATLVMGNNENYILRFLAQPEHRIRKREARYTLKCLSELKYLDRIDIIRWLSLCPLVHEFEANGDVYRCAHGYYIADPQPHQYPQVLTGLRHSWFAEDNLSMHLEPGPKYFFGHYGQPYFRENLHILDATNFEGVGAYYTDRKEFLIYY